MPIETGPGLPPLYLRVAESVRERIAAGEWVNGDVLPGELAIADEYGVSRATVAKAYDRLASENLVTRRAGVGTVVRGQPAVPRRIEVTPGCEIRARLPRPGERERARAGEWEPLIAVSRPGQPERLYPAGSTVVLVTP